MPKRVFLTKGGEVQSLAVTPSDFRRRKVVRGRRPGELLTYEEAGYRLSDQYEDGSRYEPPPPPVEAERSPRAEHSKAEAKAEPKSTAKKGEG